MLPGGVILLIAVVILAAECTQYRIIPVPPIAEKPEKLSIAEIGSALNPEGFISELGNPPDGMEVSWYIDDAKNLVASVQLEKYHGAGINTLSGISEVTKGSLRIVFSGVRKANYSEKTTTYTISSYGMVLEDLKLKQTSEESNASNSYTVSTRSSISGSSEFTYKYNGTSTTIDSPTISEITNISSSAPNLDVSGATGSGDFVFTPDTWIGAVDTSWYDADKTEFSLCTPEELAGLASLVNSGKDFEGKTITLENDIDLNNEEWTPIGKSSLSPSSGIGQMFEGTFIGNGAEISNLSINSDSNNVGFFGAVNNANISGLRFADSKLNVTGQRAAAAIGAAVDSYVSDIIVDDTCSVSGVENYAGGVIGAAWGVSISECVNKADVSGGFVVGGITGYLEQLSSAGNVTSSISDCKNEGNITASNPYGLGGIAGNATSDETEEDRIGEINITGCTNSGKIENTSTSTEICTGGILGRIGREGGKYEGSILVNINGCSNSGEIIANTVDISAEHGIYGAKRNMAGGSEGITLKIDGIEV